MGLDRTKLSVGTKESKATVVNEKSVKTKHDFKVLTREQIENNRIKAYDYAI